MDSGCPSSKQPLKAGQIELAQAIAFIKIWNGKKIGKATHLRRSDFKF
jgi:hypothetical protein